MPPFIPILADAGPIIGVIFLILWGIISLMNVAKKQQQRRQQPQDNDFEFPDFEPMEEQTPPPPPPPTPWQPREERPKPVHRPPPQREESEWNQRPAPRPPREVRPPREARLPKSPRHAREARRDPHAPPAARPAAAELGQTVTATDISRTEIGSGPESAGEVRSERARRLARELSPRRAREAILLAEVLAPPVALRSNQFS